MKVLIGEVSSYKAIVVIKYLRKNYPSLEILTYDFKFLTKKNFTKFSSANFLIEKPNLDSYIKNLSELISRENIELFLPVHSDYIDAILKKKSIFGNSLDYLGNYELYEKLHDKKSLQEFASTLNISIPINYSSYENGRIPFIAKPARASSSKGVMYFTSIHERIKKNKINSKNYIFQQYIDGVGCGYSVYAKNGKIITGYGHLRLAEFPVTGGSSVYREGFYVNEMKEIAEKILVEVPWTGFAMFEFKLKPDGELILIEVNPRLWGSINQGLQNGVNYFEPILGKPTKTISNTKHETKTYLSPQIYLSLFLYLLKGNLKPLFTFIKNIKHNKADVSIFDDPKGWLSIILRRFL